MTRSEFSRRAFVLTEEDLRALGDLLSTLGGIKYTLECSDGLSRKCTSLEGVLRFDNSPTRSIIRLEVSARAADSSAWVTASLGDEAYSNLRIHMDGPEESIVGLNRELESRLTSMKPWYSALTRGDLFLLGWAFLMVLVFLVAAIAAFGRIELEPSPSDPKRDAGSFVVSSIIVTLWGLLAWALQRARNRLFPIGTFALGAGRARHEFLEKIRWTVIIGFAVSVVASFFAARFV